MRKPSLNARSGIDRDEKARDRRIAASVAEQAAATPDVAESANAVNAAPEKPTLEAEQLAGRALLWDKQVDREAQAEFKAARVAQKPYVYQTQA